MIPAYSEDYLFYAQKNLGHMFDFAVNTCNIPAAKFADMFVISGIAGQFETGNSAYIAGKNGCEIAREVVQAVMKKELPENDEMYLDRSPEYWAGWALCYYQWYTGRPFKNIFAAVNIDTIIGMYNTLHEADISKFAENMDILMRGYYTDTALSRQRKIAGMTQAELSKRSGVNLRLIQKYEQRSNDINSAKISTVVDLSRALNCAAEDLLEY